jgi:U3 small nucleolar RNA-associated protein 12
MMSLSDGFQISDIIRYHGTLPIASSHRIMQISSHPALPYLAVQSHDRSVEIFRVLNESEVQKRQTRRLKREHKKDKNDQTGVAEIDVSLGTKLADKIIVHSILRATAKIRSFSFENSEAGTKEFQVFLDCISHFFFYYARQIMTALNSNSLEVYTVYSDLKTKKEVPEPTRSCSVELPGHRTDVRALCLSTDDELVASVSNGRLIPFILSRSPDDVCRLFEAMEPSANCMHSYHGVWVWNMSDISSGRTTCRYFTLRKPSLIFDSCR